MGNTLVQLSLFVNLADLSSIGFVYKYCRQLQKGKRLVIGLEIRECYNENYEFVLNGRIFISQFIL